MIRLSRIFLLVLCSVVLLMMLSGSASASVEYYEAEIVLGDGYQINNYVIDVTDIFTSLNTAVFKVYENKGLKTDGMIGINESFKFNLENGDVDLKLLSVYSGVLPRVKVLITVKNVEIYLNGVVDGGSQSESTTYSGTPILEITTTVDVDNIEIGDFVEVTVNAKNTGDDGAIDVRFSPAAMQGFSLDKISFEYFSAKSIDVGGLYPVYLHRYKATKEGSFTLKPTTADFYNAAGLKFQASSNTLTITVTAPEVQEVPKKNAVLELSTDVDRMTVKRNDKIIATISIKNTGDAPASAVWIDMIIPQDLEYVSGDSTIEVIGGVPKIYMESFGVQQEKEFTYAVKASELGTYTLTTKLSYEYDNGVDAGNQKVSTESVTGNVYVQKGKYDGLLEQPIYVYALPIIAIIAIGAWIFHRHKQYKF